MAAPTTSVGNSEATSVSEPSNGSEPVQTAQDQALDVLMQDLPSPGASSKPVASFKDLVPKPSQPSKETLEFFLDVYHDQQRRRVTMPPPSSKEDKEEAKRLMYDLLEMSKLELPYWEKIQTLGDAIYYWELANMRYCERRFNLESDGIRLSLSKQQTALLKEDTIALFDRARVVFRAGIALRSVLHTLDFKAKLAWPALESISEEEYRRIVGNVDEEIELVGKAFPDQEYVRNELTSEEGAKKLVMELTMALKGTLNASSSAIDELQKHRLERRTKKYNQYAEDVLRAKSSLRFFEGHLLLSGVNIGVSEKYQSMLEAIESSRAPEIAS